MFNYDEQTMTVYFSLPSLIDSNDGREFALKFIEAIRENAILPVSRTLTGLGSGQVKSSYTISTILDIGNPALLKMPLEEGQNPLPEIIPFGNTLTLDNTTLIGN